MKTLEARGTIHISLIGGGEVRIRAVDVSRGVWAEIEHLLIPNGGLPGAEGMVAPVLGFRRVAVDLASVLRRFPGEVRLDEEVSALLREHLAEIEARRAAEVGLEPLDRAEVERQSRAGGRFDRPLTEQQVDNLGRLLALLHGANFSVPGAGKTTTLIATYEAVRGRGDVDRLLVVAPKNAFLSWETEIQLCFSELPSVVRLTGGKSGTQQALSLDPEVALITYQLLPNVLDLVLSWARRHSVHVVLDESHRIKGGAAGVLAGAALQLASVGVRRDILSGTPLPQAPEDLRPQLDFLWPGHRIMPDLRVVAEAPDLVIDEVQRSVQPLYVRTTKNQLDLPPLIGPRPLFVELGPLQGELYQLLRSEAARAAAGMTTRDRRFFRMLGRHVVRLLQTAANPMLLTQGDLVGREDIEPLPQGVKAWELLRDFARYEQPAKIERVATRAAEVIEAGGKVVIWSSFILNLLAMERVLEAQHPVVLFGQVPTGPSDDPETREGRIRRFHEDDSCRVMIANPAACGEGVSLHRACHHAIYLDRTFNAAHFLQSVDRIHRLGLAEDVLTTVEIVEARDTIDQRVAQRLQAKIEAMARILNDPGLAALAYDPEDIVEEFPGGLEPEDVEEVVDHLFEDAGDE